MGTDWVVSLEEQRRKEKQIDRRKGIASPFFWKEKDID